MLIDYKQFKDYISLSYVDDNRNILHENIQLKEGYYSLETAEEFESNDPRIVKGKRSFINNKLIKKVSAYSFNKHNLNEFINVDLKNNYADIYEKISKLNIPKPFSVDIETEITDQYGYSNQHKAENKILSISITDEKLNTLVFALPHSEVKNFTDVEKLQIRQYLKDALGDKYFSQYDFNFEIRVFETEFEMLAVFLDCMQKYFPSIFGWNFAAFDWVYISNRCKLIGLKLESGSPIMKLTNKKVYISNKDSVDLQVPTHRVIDDYMLMFKFSLIYNNLESYSLNFCAELILDLKKVMYTGNLRTLYRTNYLKFIAYAIIDTVLVMLIHKKTNLYGIDFFESYYNNIFYQKLSQTSISEALVYNHLLKKNIFFPTSEHFKATKREFKGGYVKIPTKKIVYACWGYDFSGLYPNGMITCGLSTEKKVDFINVDELGKPLHIQDTITWQKYADTGNYILAPTGRIYDKSTDGIFVEIEKELINERQIYKGHKATIYLEHITKLENLIKQKEQEAA